MYQFRRPPKILFLLGIDVGDFARPVEIGIGDPEIGIFFKAGLGEEEDVGVFGFGRLA